MTEAHKWDDQDSPFKGANLSTSTSSFEALDPHDPNLSQLATTTFQKTSDYLRSELSSTQDHYHLLEEMNRVTITKYSDMKHIASNLGKSIAGHNEMYAAMISPYLREIDAIEENINKVEQAAYKLDNYTKQLLMKFKSLKQ